MKYLRACLATATAALVPQAAWAHEGFGAHGFEGGLVHPVSGIDHVAVMFLVGLAATLFPDRNRWFVLAAFPAGLLGGFVMSATVPGAVVEAAILVSLIATGLAIAARLKTPVWLAMLAVAGFGYAHGAAHGIEMPDYVMPAAFVAGFLVTSVVVHATGYWLARKLPIKVLQAIGAGGAGLGLVLAGA